MSIIKRNNINVSGEGQKPMIFAHGFGCDQNMWRFVAPEFERDHKVILFDHVGAGRSDLGAYDQKKYATLEGYADDVVEICEALNVENGIFVGHSVSAMIGALASIKSPKHFEKLVLVCPSPCYLNDGDYQGGFSRQQLEELLEFLDENHMGWSAQMAPLIMGNADRPELSEELENSFCRTDPDIARAFARATFLSDNRADLASVRPACLVLQCKEDVIAGQQVGKYVKEHIPDAHLALIDAYGHCPNLSAPDEVIKAMRDFV
ncbi:alpha/beta hydrolase [Nitratireductor sp. B36]|uniref:alpha/beta fold hydrolase n=1 Tax=Nitratireductor sp. B36 TaxID=2762059 RepID=UPI001E2B22EC|nr:alpha/beta hydrolase [Nitratireductor sp. B36]MCC5779309.1 alpha/beta hydrolase [Nitratireductor sp. B36]